MNHPILLSPPEAGPAERAALIEAVDSGWLAPAGPALDAFEAEVAAVVGRGCGVGLSSGTAALHLALLVHGVGPGDDVLVSTLTFAATVNAIVYTGATPVLIDRDASTWNLSPDLLAEELDARRARPPKAAIVVDLYGQSADQARIMPLLAAHDVLHIVDAAESLGATFAGRPTASYGAVAALSFNGNKIITTTGGGMLVTDDPAIAARVRHLATQAREPAAHYQHVEVGYNYRLSNLLAAFGRAQLADLDRRVARRREIFDRYVAGLSSIAGLQFMPEAAYGRSNRWLTCITLDEEACGFTPEELRLHLEADAIEARPTWKPLHQQPVFAHCPSRLDGTSDTLFRTGLCLPSGSGLSAADQDRVVARILELAEARA
ncbi:MAG: aminotransferase class I/II-fold pyridoxal phosphate-dependent enzyme [Acidimicrobiales bacterium]